MDAKTLIAHQTTMNQSILEAVSAFELACGLSVTGINLRHVQTFGNEHASTAAVETDIEFTIADLERLQSR